MQLSDEREILPLRSAHMLWSFRWRMRGNAVHIVDAFKNVKCTTLQDFTIIQSQVFLLGMIPLISAQVLPVLELRHQFSLGLPAFPFFLFYFTTTGSFITANNIDKTTRLWTPLILHVRSCMTTTTIHYYFYIDRRAETVFKLGVNVNNQVLLCNVTRWFSTHPRNRSRSQQNGYICRSPNLNAGTPGHGCRWAHISKSINQTNL